MEEKPNPPAQQAESEKITSRRSRKDQEGRDYQCGCGKRYLSYPALYTHIKTKHEGKQPEGTLKTGTAQIAKRTKLKLQEETLRSIQSFFTEFQSQAVSQLGDVVRGHISMGSRIKKEGVSKQIYDHYLHLVKQQSQFKLSEQSSLELALIVFLVKIGDIVNDKIYDQFLMFARLARACFYEHGDQIHRALFSKKDQGPFQLKQFNIHYVKYFPMISDFFIRFYIPETESKDTKEANLSLMEVITYDFCNWLHSSKLSNIKVNMNKAIVIDFKPPATTVKIKTTPGKVESHKQKQLFEKCSDEKENKDEQQHEGSEDISEAQELEEDLDRDDRHPSGSKQNEEI